MAIYFFNVYLFLRKRERKYVHEWERGRERGRERIPSRLCADVGLELPNHEIMT